MPPRISGRYNGMANQRPNKNSEPPHLDAVLAPNRSLQPTGHSVLFAALGLCMLGIGAYFYFLGAWPILGFLGLDLFLIWGAFKLSYRQGRLREFVKLYDDELIVSRVLPSGHEMQWRLQPSWVKLETLKIMNRDSQVSLVSMGKRLILGSFLSPKERKEFANALHHALSKSRSGVCA